MKTNYKKEAEEWLNSEAPWDVKYSKESMPRDFVMAFAKHLDLSKKQKEKPDPLNCCEKCRKYSQLGDDTYWCGDIICKCHDKKDRCLNGHLYSEHGKERLYKGHVWRFCVTCNRAGAKERYKVKEKVDDIIQTRLKELVDYNPNTGEFRWKTEVGNIAGYIRSNGYVRIELDRKSYLAHRLVWLYVHGKWPIGIDHINHDKTDNRIENLREVTRAENQKNLPVFKNNTSGVPGVSWSKSSKKWQANIKTEGKVIYLGLFQDKNEAIKAREEAKIKYGFHPNHK